MRELFSRREIIGEVISLRHSLANHVGGLQLGLREAHTRFSQPTQGEGHRRGCHDAFRQDLELGTLVNWGSSGEEKTQLRESSFVMPEWVPVDDLETRTVEGVLIRSKISHQDWPARPWHTYYDWTFHVRVDPQYTYLLTEYNRAHTAEGPNGEAFSDVLECEWDTGFFPGKAQQAAGERIRIWPQVGDRIWMVGRWIYDCGHPCRPEEDHSNDDDRTDHGPNKTELHPVKAMVFFRPGAVQFEGNAGPTRANNAVLYMGTNGGYFRQPLNDQDYAFDLYLPPKLHPEAVPRWTFEPLPPARSLPVNPLITPYPADAPRALRVVIPLQGVIPAPDVYAAIISGGWSDPDGTETQQIRRVRVTVENMFIIDPHEKFAHPFNRPAVARWHVYIGINGVWTVRELLLPVDRFDKVPNESDVDEAFLDELARAGFPRSSLSFNPAVLNFSVGLRLHPEEKIHITACGFEANDLHHLIGKDSGLTWEQISDPTLTETQRRKIMEKLIEEALDKHWYGIPDRNLADNNKPLGLFSEVHFPREASESPFDRVSDKRDYRLRYRIDESPVPERTRSLRRFLLMHGFNPANGVRQVGSGSLKNLMGLE
jgi:hypothetical protein